jgi:hypothetical protein
MCDSSVTEQFGLVHKQFLLFKCVPCVSALAASPALSIAVQLVKEVWEWGSGKGHMSDLKVCQIEEATQVEEKVESVKWLK